VATTATVISGLAMTGGATVTKTAAAGAVTPSGGWTSNSGAWMTSAAAWIGIDADGFGRGPQ
jgi:hypothetical protein